MSKNKVWYVIGVVTLRALVCAGDQTSGDARSGYMISRDAKSWKKNNDQKGTTFRRINEGVNNNREPCDDRLEDSENENEVAEIFRIETDVFNYESPMCKALDEFNYLLKIDPDVLTKYIPGFKTYEQFKNDWIYKWNDKIPWVSEKPWIPDGIWKEPDPVKHYCEPFNYKNRNQIHYQNYEWYEALVNCELKDEALRNKAELEKSMNHEGESSDDAWSNYLPIDEWSDQGEGDNTKPYVNHNPYLDIAQLFNSHTKKQGGGDDQEKNENIGEDDDHLVRGDAQLNNEC
ncbi:hypothetical protein Tco_1043078 [Tanacetum coccineum]|uniref:Uncharacterized protein n=1 Tax=Tanacetum coccineum TaxID=301880 RepID=A0ABQ5GLE4_9ASTR